jgi:hypothetical protein
MNHPVQAEIWLFIEGIARTFVFGEPTRVVTEFPVGRRHAYTAALHLRIIVALAAQASG